jgi:hypothetical protein
MKSRFWAALSLVAVAALARLIPHPANATPVVAMALFSGAVFTRRAWSIVIPLAAMVISDLALGFHNQIFSVYGSLVLISLIGFALSADWKPGQNAGPNAGQSDGQSAGQNSKRRALRAAGASLMASFVFFIVTNLTVWQSGDLYPHTFSGLLDCYVLALPFFRNGLLGDLFFSSVLFGAWAYLTSSVFVGSPVRSFAGWPAASKDKGAI